MSDVTKFKPQSDPKAETMLLIEQLRVERVRLQAEIDRIVRELQIQIDRATSANSGDESIDCPELD
jgi:hypothetical protein